MLACSALPLLPPLPPPPLPLPPLLLLLLMTRPLPLCPRRTAAAMSEKQSWAPAASLQGAP